MEHNTKSLEQNLAHLEREAWQQVAKAKMSVAEKMARKYGSTDGEASDAELDELEKKFAL